MRANPFTFQIHCAAGLLCSGASFDFLLVVYRAKLAKQKAAGQLPNSTLRAQICAPNGERVPSVDLKAALRALEDSIVFTLLRKRNPASFPPVLAVAVDVAFSQAGVVAPPDSPDLGNLLHCNCRKSDAWRCAVDRSLASVSCRCSCHLSKV